MKEQNRTASNIALQMLDCCRSKLRSAHNCRMRAGHQSNSFPICPFAAFLRDLLPPDNRCAQHDGQEMSNRHWSNVMYSLVSQVTLTIMGSAAVGYAGSL